MKKYGNLKSLSISSVKRPKEIGIIVPHDRAIAFSKSVMPKLERNHEEMRSSLRSIEGKIIGIRK